VQMDTYGQVARERQRDMWADAQRRSQARQFVAQARESRRAKRARRRMRQAFRRAVRAER